MKLMEVALNESRGRKIEMDQVVQAIKGDYSDAWTRYVKGNYRMWRGANVFGQFFHYNTMSEEHRARENANTDPFVNELLDHSENWKEWPPRSRSLICSTDEQYAEGYGRLFLVLPKNETLIGAVEGPDFWTAFDGKKAGLPHVNDGYGVGEMRRIVQVTAGAIALFIMEKMKQSPSDHRWGDLEKVFKDLNIKSRVLNLDLLIKADEAFKKAGTVITGDVFAEFIDFLKPKGTPTGPGGRRDEEDNRSEEMKRTGTFRTAVQNSFKRGYITEKSLREFMQGKGVLKTYDSILDPKTARLYYGKIDEIHQNDGEVWFAGESILVHASEINDLERKMGVQ